MIFEAANGVAFFGPEKPSEPAVAQVINIIGLSRGVIIQTDYFPDNGNYVFGLQETVFFGQGIIFIEALV